MLPSWKASTSSRYFRLAILTGTLSILIVYLMIYDSSYLHSLKTNFSSIASSFVETDADPETIPNPFLEELASGPQAEDLAPTSAVGQVPQEPSTTRIPLTVPTVVPSNSTLAWSDLFLFKGSHPIDRLSRQADKDFQILIEDQPSTLAEAAKSYRAKRGRHPPPGFDVWFKHAQENGVIASESLFDNIYEDLEPFWGAKPVELRRFAARWPNTITIRRGKASKRLVKGIPFNQAWINQWVEMIELMPPLPDVDLAMGMGDEPRVMLSFQRINEYMSAAQDQKDAQKAVPVQRIRNNFPRYSKLRGSPKKAPPQLNFIDVSKRGYWSHVADACKPSDPFHTEPHRRLNDSVPPVFSPNYTTGTLQGFVSNFTQARNPCFNPNVRSLHGHLIKPHIDKIYTDLQPLFTVAKVAGASNDILVPPPEHWMNEGYAGLEETIPWEVKQNQAIWRGSATGGQHDQTNWWGFERHRLIAMMNGTTVAGVEARMSSLPTPPEPSYPAMQAAAGSSWDWGLNNIAYPLKSLFDIVAQRHGKLGRWAAEIADGGFTHFYCAYLRLMSPAGYCPYVEDYYHIVSHRNVSQILHHKYLPDVDGQSSSGRFRSYLQSLSVPIKATLFVEWRDARLIPWRHFVPMSNEFQEWWGIMEYFIGYKGDAEKGEESKEGHDQVAERIGRLGSEWSRKVERKEDMVAYFYRLILEYARICADEKVRMGYTADLSMS